jgi:xanthine dehydrogenase iron-sulfur cluster and FAD-binding subunit A
MKEPKACSFDIASVAGRVTSKKDIVANARIVFADFTPVRSRAIGAEQALKGKKIRDTMDTASTKPLPKGLGQRGTMTRS